MKLLPFKLNLVRIHSFRLRVALLSALLAGSAIAGFSFLSFFLFYQAKLTSLDNEIKDQLLRESAALRPISHWELYVRSRTSFFGEDTQPAFALLAIAPDGSTLYKSESWNPEFDRQNLFPQQTTSNESNDLKPVQASFGMALAFDTPERSAGLSSELDRSSESDRIAQFRPQPQLPQSQPQSQPRQGGQNPNLNPNLREPPPQPTRPFQPPAQPQGGQNPDLRGNPPPTLPAPTITIAPLVQPIPQQISPPVAQPTPQPQPVQTPNSFPTPASAIAPTSQSTPQPIPQIKQGGQTTDAKEPSYQIRQGGQTPDLRGNPPPPRTTEPIGKLSNFVTQTTSTGTWRIGAISTPFVRMAIAVNLQAIDREMNSIRNVFFLTIPFTLILVMLGAWWLSGGALQPIEKMTKAIRQITAKGLNQRVPTEGTDAELLELLQVFNQMMERLERSFLQASRFSADAAHELKTPLAILQGELERTLQQAESGSEFQKRLSELLDEVRRLNSITRKLLLLSLADAGRMSVSKAAIDLSEVLMELGEDVEMLAPDLEIQVQIEAGIQVQGDRELLIQVLQNLIGNAIKYNLPHGWLRINSGRNGNFVFITIANSSKDIPERDRAKIFDRFHRGDAARTRHVEGFGLGLSLSQEIARAHGGDLKLDRTPEGHTAFTLTVPVAAARIQSGIS